MKIYKDKSRGKSYFYYFGWTIIAFFGLFFLLFFLIFQNVYKIKPYQKIDFFWAAYGLKDRFYQQEILKEYEDDGLLEINMYDYPFNDPKLYDYYQAYGENSDFVILSEGDLVSMQEVIKDKFMALNDLLIDCPTINNYETFVYEELSYGVKLFDKNNDEYNHQHHYLEHVEFTAQGQESFSYYLLVNQNSVNFDKENNHVFGYLALEYFLSINERQTD